jgi:cellulose biosynthesis protein BcsQ
MEDVTAMVVMDVVLIPTERWKFAVSSLANVAIVQSVNVALLTHHRMLRSTMDV